jgi:hypothetical protein
MQVELLIQDVSLLMPTEGSLCGTHKEYWIGEVQMFHQPVLTQADEIGNGSRNARLKPTRVSPLPLKMAWRATGEYSSLPGSSIPLAQAVSKGDERHA